MREFGRPPQDEHAPADLNDALRSTLAFAAYEYKYVASPSSRPRSPSCRACAATFGEINQVFLNLIVNAAHAIGDSGRRGEIRITTVAALDHAIVTISDDGPGIPFEIRERIFDPFFTTKEVGRETGQGLAIARSIVVDKHAGGVIVESEPGHGATFTVRLPLEPGRSGPACRTPSAAFRSRGVRGVPLTASLGVSAGCATFARPSSRDSLTVRVRAATMA